MKWIDEILRPKASMILSFFMVIIDFSAVFEENGENIWFNTLNASLFLTFVQNTTVFFHHVFLHFIAVKTTSLDSGNGLVLFVFMRPLYKMSCDLFKTFKTNILLLHLLTNVQSM